MRIIFLFFILTKSLHPISIPFPYVIESLENEYTKNEEEDKKEIIIPPSKEKPKTLKRTKLTLDPALFPQPEGLMKQVNFWRDVYSKYHSYEVVIHDTVYPFIVYEVINIKYIKDKRYSNRTKRREINRLVKKKKHFYRKILRKIHYAIKRESTTQLSEDETRIFKLFSVIEERNKFLRATYRRRMRMQIGQRDRFEEGIKLSGYYLPIIETIFKERGLPVPLTRLIFVESMFNLYAYSKVGASGIWQFMKSTGKRFLEINYAIDERRDPVTATHAAASLLSQNFEKLNTWPLAITAYNHGSKGMARAVRLVGTTDIVEIIKRYRSRTFGIASKNFYAEFLAAFEVENNQEKYFGHIPKYPPLQYSEFELKDYLSFKALTETLSIPEDTIKGLNPSLKTEVFQGHARIPKGFRLKLPEDAHNTLQRKYSEIPEKYRHDTQSRRKYYRVKFGDSLWSISRRFKKSIQSLKRVNNIYSRHIRPGQLLIIP